MSIELVNVSLALPFPPQGKFIRINFDQGGYIAGANIETCIHNCLTAFCA